MPKLKHQLPDIYAAAWLNKALEQGVLPRQDTHGHFQREFVHRVCLEGWADTRDKGK